MFCKRHAMVTMQMELWHLDSMCSLGHGDLLRCYLQECLIPTEFTTTVTSDGTTPIEGANVVFNDTGSTDVRYDGVTDANGQVEGALRTDGGKKYNFYITADGYEPYFEAGPTPLKQRKL